jgi:Na+-transporting NADH:ubiquinone oxidoreductase subunit NqrD
MKSLNVFVRFIIVASVVLGRSAAAHLFTAKFMFG